VLAPVLPERPPLLREVGGSVEQVAGRMARFAKFLRLFNGLGIPVLSLPCGYTEDGVPLGVQLAAPPFEEARLLAIGAAYEDSQRWFTRRPLEVLPALKPAT
jgi:aspartyl-tRNA(Asn)/glutamyl-tRNA(Gln) amidotransferase subunit A